MLVLAKWGTLAAGPGMRVFLVRVVDETDCDAGSEPFTLSTCERRFLFIYHSPFRFIQYYGYADWEPRWVRQLE